LAAVAAAHAFIKSITVCMSPIAWCHEKPIAVVSSA
jgi:hypothetical protein